MTGTEILVGLGVGIALIAGIVAVSLVPWRFPWAHRHDVRGGGDHADWTAVKTTDRFDAGGDGDGGD